VSDSIKFSRVIQGELPFTLNLPSGSYRVKLDDYTYHLELIQGWLKITVDAKTWMIGTSDDLQARIGDRWDSIYKHELRTMVRRIDAFVLTREELPTPDNDQLRDAAIRRVLENNPGYVPRACLKIGQAYTMRVTIHSEIVFSRIFPLSRPTTKLHN